jgi:hypothetical protein
MRVNRLPFDISLTPRSTRRKPNGNITAHEASLAPALVKTGRKAGQRAARAAGGPVADLGGEDQLAAIGSDAALAEDRKKAASTLATAVFATPAMPEQHDACLGDRQDLAAPPDRPLQGYIDEANSNRIAGWVWNPQQAQSRIVVELVDGDTRLAKVMADQYRSDLRQAGIGDGRHAFIIPLSEAPLPASRNVLHLRCAGTGTEVPGSPIIIERAMPAVAGQEPYMQAVPYLPASASDGIFADPVDEPADTDLVVDALAPAALDSVNLADHLRADASRTQIRRLIFLTDRFVTDSASTRATISLFKALEKLGMDIVVGCSYPYRDCGGTDIWPAVPSPHCIRMLAQNSDADAMISLTSEFSVALAQTQLNIPRWAWLGVDPTLAEAPATAHLNWQQRDWTKFFLEEVYPYLSGVIFKSEYARFTSRLPAAYHIPMPMDYVPSRAEKGLCAPDVGVDPVRGALVVGTLLGEPAAPAFDVEIQHLNQFASLVSATGVNATIKCMIRPETSIAELEDRLAREVEVVSAASVPDRGDFFNSLNIFVSVRLGDDAALEAVEAQRAGAICLVLETPELIQVSPFNFKSYDEQARAVERYALDRRLLIKHINLTRRFCDLLPSSEDVAISLISAIDRYRREGCKRDGWHNPRLTCSPAVAPFLKLLEAPERDFIIGAYQLVLGRGVDPAGLAHFDGRVKSKDQKLDAIDDLMASAEYHSRFSGNARTEWIRQWVSTSLASSSNPQVNAR